MPSVEQCRAYAADHKILGVNPEFSPPICRADNISRNGAIANQLDKSCDHREIEGNVGAKAHLE